jgi:uncharacterized protein
MAEGLPDKVDCVRLAEDGAVLERVYRLADLPRLEGLLADPRGTLDVRFAFSRLEAGGPGGLVRIRCMPRLKCQRCMQGFDHAIDGQTEVEFAELQSAAALHSEREVAGMNHGQVSLRDLAEEELLLALPLAPKCDAPTTCGNAPRVGGSEEVRRPFSGLQDLLKKT